MESNLSFRGSLATKKITRPKAPLFWKLRNLPNLLRAWKVLIAKAMGTPTFYGKVEALLIKADGSVVDYGTVSLRLVTTAFVTALATYMFDASGPAPSAYDHHASGTGTTAENAGDTAMETDSGVARTNGTPTNPSAGLYRSVGTMAYTGALAITEHGLFSAATVGTLLDRSVFAAINVVNGDSIQFTYTLTCTAGG